MYRNCNVTVRLHGGAAGPGVGEENDTVLLARHRAGDSTAFDALYRAHYDLLWRFAYRHVGQAETAEDVVHDVFATLWHQRQTVRIRTTLTAYLIGAVHKRAIDAVRRQGVIERTAAAGDAVALGTAPLLPDARVETGEARAAVARAVANLPLRQRLAVALRWQDQLRYVEIADALGVTEAAVRKLVAKAQVTLSRALRAWRADAPQSAALLPPRLGVEPTKQKTRKG
jgi:RNA polymerase sigma-70 factor (ECF subfamily)